jgi:hypothetical protein
MLNVSFCTLLKFVCGIGWIYWRVP